MKAFMMEEYLPDIKDETELKARDFLDDWELQELLINDEKLMESKNDETGPCKHSE